MKRTLSLLVALVMVISMVPNVFAADDSVDFDDLIYLETYSPLTVNIEAGATEPVEFLWVPTEEGTLTYDINNADTTVSIVLAQGENTATSEAGVVALNVVAGEEVSIKISDTTGAAVENLVINGTFGKVCVHEAGEAVQENVVDATCTEAGSYDSVVYCTLCGEKLSTTAVVVDALGHSWDDGVYHEATTEANAYTVYTCTVCGETKTEEVPDSILPANIITTQPTNDIKAKGKVATFTIEAEGAVSYQWQRIKSGATVWTNITGATSATYSVTVSDATIIPYRCVVTDANGKEYISDEVTIVEPDPLVTVLNEGGNLHVIKNTVVSFHVELDNVEGVTFQWQREKITGRWFNVKNNGYDTDTVSFTASPYGNYPYRCEITDANGTKIYSGIYTLTFYEPPVNPRIVKNPVDAYVHAGGFATFTVQAEGSSFVDDGSEDTGVTYQWWRKRGNSSWTYITETTSGYTGHNTDTLTVKVWSTMGTGYLYMCEVKDGYGNTLRTTEVTHYVVTPVTITAQPTATLGEDGATATFTFAASGDVKSYWWESLKGDTWYPCNYEGYNTDTLTTNVKRSYRCKITDMAGVVTYTDVVAFPTAN